MTASCCHCEAPFAEAIPAPVRIPPRNLANGIPVGLPGGYQLWVVYLPHITCTAPAGQASEHRAQLKHMLAFVSGIS